LRAGHQRRFRWKQETDQVNHNLRVGSATRQSHCTQEIDLL